LRKYASRMKQNMFNRFHNSYLRSLSGLYTVVCSRKGKWGTCLGPPFASAMCKVTCFQRGPTATVMYKQATLLSKGPPTAAVMCKYLAFKGSQITVMHKHFSFKGSLTSPLISSDSYCNLGIEAFSGAQNSDGTEFWAPCDSVGLPIRGYGMRLWMPGRLGRLSRCSYESEDFANVCLKIVGLTIFSWCI